MGIASLDTAGPTSSNLLSTGAADIRALRTAIRESFVNFGIGTDVVTATAAQINGAPNKAGAETISGAWVFTAPVTVPVGSPSAPSIAFAGDSNTGMYSEGSNVINFATEGVERLSITGSEVAVQAPIWVPDGTVSLPSLTFKDDTDTGFYRSNGGEVSFVADGLLGARFNVSGLSLHRISSNWTGIQFYNSAGDRRGLLDLDSEDGNLALYPVTGSGSGAYGNPIFQYVASTGAVHYNHCMRMGNTSAVAPAYSFQSAGGSGLWSNGGAQVGLAVDGTNHFTFTASGLEGPATGVSSGDNRYSTNAGVVAALTEIASYDTLYNAGEPLPIGAAAEIGGWDTATNATAKYSEVTGATDGRMTVATTGTYRIDFCANFATGGVEALVIELRKNGSALTCPAFTKVSLDATENAIDNASISVLVDASASEYFSLYSSGLTIDTAAMTNAHFTVQRVR